MAAGTPSDHPGSRFRVNSGRPATRIGGDSIPVYVDIPRERSDALRRILDKHQIPFSVSEGYAGIRGDSERPAEVTKWIDRFVFPQLVGEDVGGSERQRAADRVQRLVDATLRS